MSTKGFRILLFTVLFAPCLLAAELNKVISIGSNDLNYLFFKVAGAVLNDDGAVYVLDSKGFFLRKYDARGVFVREIGKHGQGPGDFSNVLSGICLDRDIYVLDAGNSRIVEIGRDLNVKGSLRVGRQARHLVKMGDLFYMVASRQGGPFSEIIICDTRGEFKGAFFENRPAYMEGAPPAGMDSALWKMYADLSMAVDKGSQEVAVAFRYPGQTCEIFLHAGDGRFLRRIDIDHPIRYDFPAFRLKWPLSFPDRSQLISLGSAHFLSPGKMLLEYWLETYESNRAVNQQKYLLVIDTASGKVIHKEPIDPMIDILDAKGSLLCARQEDGDIARVVVYRLIY